MRNIIERILIPVDFSRCSDRAVTYAVRLAARLDASIELMHVVEDPILSGAWSPDIQVPSVLEMLETLSREAEVKLAAMQTATRAQGITTSSVVRPGRPSQAIVEHAEAGRFDLIVMGTHGRTGLSHALLGSVAERVLRHAPCAVLTLKEQRAEPRRATGTTAA